MQHDAFREWAIVELMGHRSRCGLVTEVEIAGTKLLRIDVPAEPAGVTEFYGAAAIYSIRPVSEAMARDRARELGDVRPIQPIGWRPPDLVELDRDVEF